MGVSLHHGGRHLSTEMAADLVWTPDSLTSVEFHTFYMGFRLIETMVEDIVYTITLDDYTCKMDVWQGQPPGPKPGSDTRDWIDDNPKQFISFRHTSQPNLWLRFSMIPRSSTLRVSTSNTINLRDWDESVSVSGVSGMNQRNCRDAMRLVPTDPSPKVTSNSAKVKTDQLLHVRVTAPDVSCGKGAVISQAEWIFAGNGQAPNSKRCVDPAGWTRHQVKAQITDDSVVVQLSKLPLGLVVVCNTFTISHRDIGQFRRLLCPKLVIQPETSGELTQPVNQPLVLDASASFITEDTPIDETKHTMLWSCQSTTAGGTPTACPQDVLTTPNDAKTGVTSLTAGNKYEITFTVRDLNSTPPGELLGSTTRVVNAVPPGPAVRINCDANCEDSTATTDIVSLSAECSSCTTEQEKQIKYHWEIKDSGGNPVPNANNLVEGGRLDQNSITLKSDSLRPGSVYNVHLTLSENNVIGKGSATYKLNTKGGPRAGKCDIYPPIGSTIVTKFTLNCYGFSDPDQPLLYRAYATIPATGEDFLIAYGLSDNPADQIVKFNDLCPPVGNVLDDNRLHSWVEVTDSTGATMKVYPASEAGKSAFDAMVERSEILNSAKRAKFGNSAGQLGTTFGVVQFMNKDAIDDKDAERRQRRARVRENILSSLMKTPATNADALQQAVSCLEQVTAVPSDLTPSVTDLAEEVLEYVSTSLADLDITTVKEGGKLATDLFKVLDRLTTVIVARERKVVLRNKTTPAQIQRSARSERVIKNIGRIMLRKSGLPRDTTKVVKLQKSAAVGRWQKVKKDKPLEVDTGDMQETHGFGAYLGLDPSQFGAKEGSSVDMMLTVAKDNIYMYAKSARNLNMPVVNARVEDRKTGKAVASIENVTDFAALNAETNFIITRNSTEKEREYWPYQRVSLARDSGDKYVLDDSRVLTFKAAANHSIMVWMNVSDPSIRVDVSAEFVSADDSVKNSVLTKTQWPRRSDTLERVGPHTQDPNVFILPARNESLFTHGDRYLVTLDVTETAQVYSTLDEVPAVYILTGNLSCNMWDSASNDFIKDPSCHVGPISAIHVLDCRCMHLSVFTGSLLVAPNFIDLTDVELFLEFFTNPVMIMLVILIWNVYFMGIWFFRKHDEMDEKKREVIVLLDNNVHDDHVYLVCTVTGWWRHAGTSARVYMYLKGTLDKSRVHRLTGKGQKLFMEGAENWFLVTTPTDLGNLKSVVVWHDNSGDSAAWFLKEVYVHKVDNKKSWHCLYDDWLSLEHGHGHLVIEAPALTPEEIHMRRMYQFALKTSTGLRTGHLWLSIFFKPPYNTFTRFQRLTCALCLLMTTMVVNLMFYGIPRNDPAVQVFQTSEYCVQKEHRAKRDLG
ncbi:hypothetical protein BaRGS_00030287 [Batillaria attramentaria]|uniref:PLAT domain-containing protein n=1 Tax=Batillaria attramentaria TaxID=370345 RepID=A0ABD0JUH1_9CAEN